MLSTATAAISARSCGLWVARAAGTASGSVMHAAMPTANASPSIPELSVARRWVISRESAVSAAATSASATPAVAPPLGPPVSEITPPAAAAIHTASSRRCMPEQRQRERPEELQGHHGPQRDTGDGRVEHEVQRRERGAERGRAHPEPPRAAPQRGPREDQQRRRREGEPQRPGPRGPVDGEHGRRQRRRRLERSAAGDDQQRAAEAMRDAGNAREPDAPRRPADLPPGASDSLHGGQANQPTTSRGGAWT